jgi:DNA-binding NarL/FixJ family response regulator
MPARAQSIRVVILGRAQLRREIHEVLAAAGMTVVAGCETREEALVAVRWARPNVCVVDRAIGGGGLIATAAIASPPRPPEVIVIGGGPAPEERRAARFAGAAEYLPGDLDAASLVAAVAALAGRARNTQLEV